MERKGTEDRLRAQPRFVKLMPYLLFFLSQSTNQSINHNYTFRGKIVWGGRIEKEEKKGGGKGI